MRVSIGGFDDVAEWRSIRLPRCCVGVARSLRTFDFTSLFLSSQPRLKLIGVASLAQKRLGNLPGDLLISLTLLDILFNLTIQPLFQLVLSLFVRRTRIGTADPGPGIEELQIEVERCVVVSGIRWWLSAVRKNDERGRRKETGSGDASLPLGV